MSNQGQEQDRITSTANNLQIGTQKQQLKQQNPQVQMPFNTFQNIGEQSQNRLSALVQQRQCQTILGQQGRVTGVQQSQINQKESQQCFKFSLEQLEYSFKVEKLIHQIPEYQSFNDGNGITWYYVENQQLKLNENGRYNPQYINQEGTIANINLNILDQWGIQITCHSDDYQYIGWLSELTITQTHNSLTIDEVFDDLVNDLNDHEQQINKQNGSINLNNNNGNMELEYITKRNNSNTFSFKWNLIKQQQNQGQDSNYQSNNQKQNRQDSAQNQQQARQCTQTNQFSTQNQRINTILLKKQEKPIVPKNQDFEFSFEEIKCKLKVRLFAQIPEQQIQNQGSIWYCDYDQKLDFKSDGKYQVQYKNEKGEVKTFDREIINQSAIVLTFIFDYYYYVGMLTQDVINQEYEYLKIDVVYDSLVNDLNDLEQQINKENGSIKLKNSNDGNMELELIINIRLGKNKKTINLKWNLFKQRDEQIVEKKLNALNKHNILAMQKLEQIIQNSSTEFEQQKLQQQEIQKEFKDSFQNISNEFEQQKLQQQEIQKEFKESFQNIQTEFKQQIKDLIVQQQEQNQLYTIKYQDLEKENQQLKEQSKLEKQQQEQYLQIINENILVQDTKLKQHQTTIEEYQKNIMECLVLQKNIISKLHDHHIPLQIPTKNIKPCNLETNNGQYYTYHLQGEDIFIFELKIKAENKLGLIIGLNQTLEFVHPYYQIDLQSELQTIGLDGKNTKHLEYEPKIDDQISFKVNLIDQTAILTANENEITSMQFEKQEQTQLYLCVGKFKKNDQIQTFIE